MNETTLQTLAELEFPPIEYGVTEKALDDLARKYSDPDASTEEGYEFCKDGVKELTGLRTAVETRRKDLKAPALDWGREVDSIAKRLIARIKAIETPVKAAKEAVDEVAREKARKAAEAEQRRVAAIRDRIDRIKALAGFRPNVKAAEYAADIEKLTGMVIIQEDFGEFVDEAQEARDATLYKLAQMRDEAEAREQADAERAQEAQRLKDEREKLLAEREELEKQRQADEDERRRLADEQAKAKKQAKTIADAARPDKEKLTDWLNTIIAANESVPVVNSDDAGKIINRFQHKLAGLCDDLDKAIAKL